MSALQQAPAAQPASSVPRARVSLDRTAVWVGDRVTLTIQISSPRGYDVLDDDLAKEKLALDGLDVVSTDTSRSEDADGRVVREFRYVLTTYRTDLPTLRVAPMSVRYYSTRAGQRIEDTAPAGDVRIPGVVVAFRSVLPEAQETFAMRDGRPPAERPQAFAMAQPVGLALVVVSIVPAAIWGIALAGKARRRTAHRSRRQARREERASLEAARALDVSTPEGRRAAYTQIDAVVREHLRDVHGIAGPSLTPAEIDAAMSERAPRVPREPVVALLAACEGARYAPPEALPSADACRDALAEAERMVTGRG